MSDQITPKNRERRGQHWRIGLSIVSLLMLIVALNSGYDSLAGYLFERHLIRRYAPITAEVMAVETKEVPAGGRRPSYTLTMSYQYAVNGRRFESSRCGLEGSFGMFPGPNSARQANALFPKGAKVTAFYNPADPADAYLLQPHVLTELIAPALLGCFSTPGLLIAAQLFFRFRRRP